MSKYYESYNRGACPYYDKCGSCSYLKLDRVDTDSNYRYWCDWKDRFYPLDDSTCSRYSFETNRDYEEVEHMERYGGSYSPSSSSCYITTIVTKLLGLGDNNELLNTLRLFRKNVLNTDIKYKTLLMEYDVVGPVIADYIENDRELYDINVLEKYIKYCVSLVKQGKEAEAVTIYTNMVNMLKEIFNISFEQVKCDNYDYTVGGHGYVKNR